MKKNIIFWLAVSALIMLVLPWLAVTFIKSDAGMAVCFLLFFVINPIYSLIVGAFAGRDIKHRWGLPVVPTALFLVGTWIFFDAGEKHEGQTDDGYAENEFAGQYFFQYGPARI